MSVWGEYNSSSIRGSSWQYHKHVGWVRHTQSQLLPGGDELPGSETESESECVVVDSATQHPEDRGTWSLSGASQKPWQVAGLKHPGVAGANCHFGNRCDKTHVGSFPGFFPSHEHITCIQQCRDIAWADLPHTTLATCRQSRVWSHEESVRLQVASLALFQWSQVISRLQKPGI